MKTTCMNENNEPHKRFVLFVFQNYEANGASSDVQASFDTLDELERYVREHWPSMWEIGVEYFDCDERKFYSVDALA